ncbi:MAG: hypothetical protein QMD13_03495 [Candidatus Bathyarchaeia archaeon]|nr:hypothetical protein [Candidatus Bathyarchaeia archaeon]
MKGCMKPLARKEVKFKAEYPGGHSSYPDDWVVPGTIFVSAGYVKFKSEFASPNVEFGFPVEKLINVKIRLPCGSIGEKLGLLDGLHPYLVKRSMFK